MSNKQLIRIQKKKPIQMGKYKSFIRSKEYLKLKHKLNKEAKEEKEFDSKPFVVNKPI